MNSTPTVVFFGTPEFALPTVEALSETKIVNLIGIITQSDKRSGRGMKITSPPVKTLALEKNIPVFQPLSLKVEKQEDSGTGCVFSATKPSQKPLVEFLNSLEKPVDLFITAAYGKIIPDVLIYYPRLGSINVHPSILPRWRGAAPIQRALFSGDNKTGVAIMQVDSGVDTGKVYRQIEVLIDDNEDLGALETRLATIGAELLIKTLPEIIESSLTPKPQSHDGLTYADKWEANESNINWADSAEITWRRIRTCSPSPGARTIFNNEQIKIFQARPCSSITKSVSCPGTIVEVSKTELIVSTGSHEKFLAVLSMQFPGKRRMTTAEILRGKKITVGECFHNL